MRRELGALLGDKSDETKAAHVTALADCATRRASLAGVGSAYVQKNRTGLRPDTAEVASAAMKSRALARE